LAAAINGRSFFTSLVIAAPSFPGLSAAAAGCCSQPAAGATGRPCQKNKQETMALRIFVEKREKARKSAIIFSAFVVLETFRWIAAPLRGSQ
jgi:hypothetical protein